MRRYGADVCRHPLLTAPEERALSEAVWRDGDPAARKRLVESNLQLVMKLPAHHHRAPLELLDLLQEGNAGLLQAVDRYDPHRGTRFATHAPYWIRGAIFRFILQNWKLVRMGTTDAQRRLFFRLRTDIFSRRRASVSAGPARRSA